MKITVDLNEEEIALLKQHKEDLEKFCKRSIKNDIEFLREAHGNESIVSKFFHCGC